jgi:hypothetical protein
MSDDHPVDAETLRQLYTTPPAGFVAARTAVVKERRQARDRAGAAAVAALRKASGVDVALNLVAITEPDLVDSFLGAADAVRDAQTAAARGSSAASTRDALRELRAQTALVVARAGAAASEAGVTGTTTAAATARLGELVANEAAGEQLRAGHLGSGPVEAVDPFGGVDASAPSAPARARRSVKAAAPPAEPDAKAIARRRRLEEALTTARERRDGAQDELDAADRAVDDAREEVAAAEARLRESSEHLERAEAAQSKAAAGKDKADAAVADAERALEEA